MTKKCRPPPSVYFINNCNTELFMERCRYSFRSWYLIEVKGVISPSGLGVKAECLAIMQAELLALTPSEAITPLTPKKNNFLIF